MAAALNRLERALDALLAAATDPPRQLRLAVIALSPSLAQPNCEDDFNTLWSTVKKAADPSGDSQRLAAAVRGAAAQCPRAAAAAFDGARLTRLRQLVARGGGRGGGQWDLGLALTQTYTALLGLGALLDAASEPPLAQQVPGPGTGPQLRLEGV